MTTAAPAGAGAGAAAAAVVVVTGRASIDNERRCITTFRTGEIYPSAVGHPRLDFAVALVASEFALGCTQRRQPDRRP